MPNYYQIGLTGTVEQFRAAQKEASSRISTPDYYSYDRDSRYSGGEDQQQLRKGAIDALFAGRAENLAAIMQNPEQFSIKSGYVKEADRNPEDARANVILEIIKRSKDLSTDFRHLAIGVPREDEKTRREVLLFGMLALSNMDDRTNDVKALAQVDLKFFPRKGKIGTVQQILAGALDEIAPVSGKDSALIEFVKQAAAYERKEEKPLQDILTFALAAAAERPANETAVWDTVKVAARAGTAAAEIQDSLNQALYGVIVNKGPEAAAIALLNAHADPNAAGSDGYKGRVLAEAVRNEASPAVIKLLQAKGADFADALHLMKTKLEENWTSAEKASLRSSCKQITGKGIPGETVQEVKAEQLEDLRAQLGQTKRELTEKTDELAAANKKLKAAKRELSDANSRISDLEDDVRRYRYSSYRY